MRPVSLVDAASYLPPHRVGNDFFGQPADPAGDPASVSPMFRAPTFRRHVGRDETAVDMIEQAAAVLVNRLGLRPARDIDILLTNVTVPDVPFTGCGAEVAHRLGCRPGWVLDLHNGGCVSFVYMIELARLLMQTTPARSALLCTVQNSAGRVFSQSEVRKLPQAAIPGDGCGVAYLVASDVSPVLAVQTQCHGEFACDMQLALDGRKYWEPGPSQGHVAFTEERVAAIITRGNRLVPQVVADVCAEADVKPADIDTLITNQPNRIFLRNWREALELPPEAHPDTFDEYGNLFGAGIPITLDHAMRAGRVKDGALLMLAGFAHAGDYAAAAAVRWRRPDGSAGPG